MVTTEQAQDAIKFVRDYTGTFQFLQDMRQRALTGQAFSENMLVAIIRCMARERKVEAVPAEPGLDLSVLPKGTIYVAVGTPLQFLKIDNVADGKWAGWVFVKRQAGDNFDRVGSQRPGSTYRGGFAQFLTEVVEDPTPFMQAYGMEIGRCGQCNRTPTDEESRARGIGPDCWERLVAAATAADMAATDAVSAAYLQGHYEMKAAFAARERDQEAAAFLADLPDGGCDWWQRGERR